MAKHDGDAEVLLKGARKAVDRVIFLPERRLLAATCDDGIVRVYDSVTKTGEERASFEKHKEKVSADKGLEGPVHLGADVLATCGYDNELCTWRASTGVIIGALKL